MTKPIGYYTAAHAGDTSLLQSLEERYGSHFERMTKRERLYLLFSLAVHLFAEESGEIGREVTEFAHLSIAISSSNQEALIEFLINQIRWGTSPSEPNNLTDG